MFRSGLIIGIIALLLAIGSALLSPLCVPCLALLLGLGAGYLAGTFDKPSDQRGAARVGVIAGALSSIGALAGQSIGALINSQLVRPADALELLRQFGMQVPLGTTPAEFARIFGASMIISTFCLGLFDIFLMAGLGTLGGLLWWQVSGSKRVVLPPSQT